MTEQTLADFIWIILSNLGSIFSMGLGAVCSAFMCWGFGRG